MKGPAENLSDRCLPHTTSSKRCEMLGLGEMKLVDGQDYSELIVVTLLYFMLVRMPISYHRLPPRHHQQTAVHCPRGRRCVAACCCVLGKS
eukprot:COSAG06_NODE_2332_length_7060_cov_3.337259_4_plen_91_part_00